MNEIIELRKLLKAKRERLHELYYKEALMGYETPIHNLTEIKKLEEEIHELESQLSWCATGSIANNDVPNVVCATIEQLKRLGIAGTVTVWVLQIHVEPAGP